MESGSIEEDSISGPIDLQATLESGQTFLWNRTPGTAYRTDPPLESTPWYETVHEGSVIAVRQTETGLEWKASENVESVIRTRLGLEDDLDAILSAFPDAPVIDTAVERYRGLRLVNEPVFETLVSFILSAQMRVERIHQLVNTLRREFGPEIRFEGESRYGFPRPEVLARVPESEFRDLGLGYRAPYVRKTAEMVAEDGLETASLAAKPYESAREDLTGFVGVGNKVADCVLLFSLGFDEAVPLDTWIGSAIEEYFPDAASDSYEETSAAIRRRFAPHPGYTQTYVFHHLRTDGDRGQR